jgi:hypothetical protein
MILHFWFQIKFLRVIDPYNNQLCYFVSTSCVVPYRGVRSASRATSVIISLEYEYPPRLLNTTVSHPDSMALPAVIFVCNFLQG